MATTAVMAFLVCPALAQADSVTTPDADGVTALANFNSLQLDAAGFPVVAYSVGPGVDTLRILHCDDADCAPGGESKQDPDSSGNEVGTHPSLVLDAAGYPVVSYRDETDLTLRILHCNDANCDPAVNGPESITTPDPSGDDVGRYTSLQLDGLGHPVVSYHDDTNGALKILHCNDANCAGGDESVQSPDVGTIVPDPAYSTIIGISTSLRLDASGYPVVAYGVFVENDSLLDDAFLKFLHCNDANCAGGDESIEIPDPRDHTVIPYPTLNGFFPNLRLPGGVPVISYLSKRLQVGIPVTLSVLRCNDPNCAGSDEEPKRADLNALSSPVPASLQIDAGGLPVLAHAPANDLRVVRCNDPTCDPDVNGAETTHEPVSPARTPSLQLDALGHPVVSFTDFSSDLRILHCNDPFCAPSPVCGDGVLEAPEQCDDSNTVPGDGCDENCQDEVLPETNAYQCYSVARRTIDRQTVGLEDDYGSSTVRVRRPRLLCAPADTDGLDPSAPSDVDHLAGYEIRRVEPGYVRPPAEMLEDQFGERLVDTRRPNRLLVPTAKSLAAPPPPLAPVLVDHYQCYHVRTARRRGVADVTIEDQFGERAAAVRRPWRLCVPVDLEGQGILDPAARLLCYRTKLGPALDTTVFFDNGFEAGTMRLKRARELCVPVVTP